MALTCGIVGLPNVGKSTLFNALTNANIAAANYPFCTIDPNVGIVNIPDARLKVLADIVHPERVVPTTMQFVDIAGLVKGASQGEGLGNKFLANIRETDAIVHVVRCFESDDIVHVAGRVNPLDDIEVIHTELALADLDTVEKQLFKSQKGAKSGDKDAKLETLFLERLKAHLDKGQPARTLSMDETEKQLLKRYFLLTAKPTLYVANVKDPHDNHFFQELEKYAQKEGSKIIALSAATEAELVGLDEAAKTEWLSVLGLEEPGLNRVIRASYDLLGLQTYFTAGVKEVRAWTVQKGATAPQAAGVIHTDFERGFIRAEVMRYEDFVACKGEQGAKEAGKLRLEGKQYVVNDGDVMHFLFNV